jgi:hypothetical protein
VSRCLSDRALMQVLADLGSRERRAHLATCAMCAARYRRMAAEVNSIRDVLTGPEPQAMSMWMPRAWIPVAATVGAVLVGVLMWVEVTLWKPVVNVDVESAELSASLAAVSAVLFTVDGEPSVASETGRPVREVDTEVAVVCDGSDWLGEIRCARTLLGVDPTVDLTDDDDDVENSAVPSSDGDDA